MREQAGPRHTSVLVVLKSLAFLMMDVRNSTWNQWVLYCLSNDRFLGNERDPSFKLAMRRYGLRLSGSGAYLVKGPIESAGYCNRQHIPEHYLDQILMVCVKRGPGESVRGPRGCNVWVQTGGLY